MSQTKGNLEQEPVEFDRRSFRDALGAFPTGVTIITTRTAAGELIGITANSFSSVSLTPPLILFSLARSAYSLKAFEQNGQFAVSVLASDQGELANRFAVSSGDKWDGTGYLIARNGCPIISGALASFECARHALFDGGDHVIVIGRVRNFEWLATGEPLVFSRGKFRALAETAETPDAANRKAEIPPPNNFNPWDGLG